MHADLLITGIGQLCQMGAGPGPQFGEGQGDLGLVEDAALAVREGTILTAGSRRTVEAEVSSAKETKDVGGALVLPGWVDAHTHMLFGSTREDEFAMRIAGKSYQEIAAAGGGIHSSVRHFRNASDQEILQRAEGNLARAVALGTTTIEIKSGYGLSLEQELRAMRLIKELRRRSSIEIVPTFLGAHELPKDRPREDYVREVIDEQIPAVAGERLAEFCDVFCEEGVFTPEESRSILLAARRAGMKLKLHADEFGETGGSALAVDLGAVSADHLHGTPPKAAQELAQAGVIGVLLPGTSFFLNLSHKAPARAMIERKLPLAVATDMNPGSNMSQSMPFMITLACIQLRMSPEEALVAATVNGAAALDRAERVGRLRPGYRADFQILDLEKYGEIPYHYGISHVREVFASGRPVLGIN